MPTANISIVKADVRALARPPTPLSVLRSKNVHTYVPGFEKRLEVMADWIAEGGQLIIDMDPSQGQREHVIEKLGPMIERLLAKGWSLRFSGFAQRRGAMETLELTRPSAPSRKIGLFSLSRADDQSKKAWKGFKDGVREIGRDPMRLFFEMMSR
jgi:hypothetical protein